MTITGGVKRAFTMVGCWAGDLFTFGVYISFTFNDGGIAFFYASKLSSGST